MATLAHQQSKAVGTTLTLGAASGGGDKIAVSSDTVLLVRNGGGGSIDVTIAVPGDEYGQARPDIVKAVAAGAFAVFGPFPADLADPDDRLVHISYSGVTSVTVAAIAV